MSMEHKAFVFDHDAFDRELRPTLERALSSHDISGLVAFINANSGQLFDPYEGEPLGEGWEVMIETPDAHQYGDFALTKYYDPTVDIGLGVLWERVQELISNDPTLVESPILGTVVGPGDAPFDPGKMGAYFQSAEQVRRHYHSLMGFQQLFPNDDNLKKAIQMLAQAKNAERGLYVTF